MRKEKVSEGSRTEREAELGCGLSWSPGSVGSHRELWSLDCTMELPPSLFEAKDPFVLLSQSVTGCAPLPGAEELLNFPGNSRLGNSHLASGNSPEKEAAVSY